MSRYTDRERYFNELAQTSREFYPDYIRRFAQLGAESRILEIGCGEGGNLLPFAEMGCYVAGLDLAPGKIENARKFFGARGVRGDFFCANFLTVGPEDLFVHSPDNRSSGNSTFDAGDQSSVGGSDSVSVQTKRTVTPLFDVVLVHDVIEHIEPGEKGDGKNIFFRRIKEYLKPDGIVFFAFPAWQMPFGGHQQICKHRLAKIPFEHLLPAPLYRAYLRLIGENESCINELLSIKRSKMTPGRFVSICSFEGYEILDRTLWFINPHYKAKFHLRPRKLSSLISWIPYFRNFFTTTCFYVIRIK